MKAAILISLAAMSAGTAGADLRLDRPLQVPGSDDLIQYDDGTANWLTWGGLYRGTWFYIYDFGASGWFMPAQSELWFFHHSSYPWDVSSFYCELYTGDQAGPVTQLDQTSVTAIHYQPVHAVYSPPYPLENFWVLENTELSAGGWPSILGDNTPQTVDHSFFSDDFIVWEPWVIQGPSANDYFIRSDGLWMGLEQTTWAAIKSTYL